MRALNHLEVKEVNLIDKRFTWSSNQQSLTMIRIGNVFCTPAWENCYDHPFLRPLSLIPHKVKTKFRFESSWPSMSGFQEIVL
jgi:hypothetical protein